MIERKEKKSGYLGVELGQDEGVDEGQVGSAAGVGDVLGAHALDLCPRFACNMGGEVGRRNNAKKKKKKNVRGGMMLMTHWLLGDLVKVEGWAVGSISISTRIYRNWLLHLGVCCASVEQGWATAAFLL